MNHEEHVQAEIEREIKINEAFNALVRDNVEIFAYLWGNGDGDGGHVLGTIRQAVTGSFFKELKPRTGYSKKDIKGALRIAVLERDAYRCKHCGTHLNLTIDHIHPEVKGGKTELENLQTLCKSCNSKKGTKIVTEKAGEK